MPIDSEVDALTEGTIRSLHRLEQKSFIDPSGQLIQATSFAEALVGKFIDRLVEESGVTTTYLGKLLVDRSAKTYHQSWSSRYDFLKDAFNISLSGSREAQELQVVVEVRNAIVHGEGMLTNRQIQNLKPAINLRKRIEKLLDAEVHGRKLVLGPSAGHDAIKIALAYVLAFDSSVRLSNKL